MSHESQEVPPSAPTPRPVRRANRIARNTGVMAASGLVVRALGMVMMIAMARYLGPQGYGTYQRAESFVLLFSILANLGLDMILAREVAQKGPRVPQEIAGVLLLKLLLGVSTFAIVLAVAGARGYHGDLLWAIWVYAVVLMMTSLGQAIDAVFQGHERFENIALANIVNQLAYVALGATFMLLGKDLRWILSALVVGGAARLAVSASLLRHLDLRWEWPRWGTVRYLFGQSIPIAFAASFVIVYQQLGTVLLGEMRGNTEVGWFRAGAKFLLLYTVLRDSFMSSMFPVFSAVAHGDARESMGGLITRTVRYLLIVALFFAVCFMFLPRIAPRLLGAEFANTANVLPILAGILIAQTVSIVMGRALVASGNQNRVMTATGLSLVVNVGLNLLLIPRYGYVGAAIANVTSEAGVALMNVWYVNRHIARTHILRSILRPLLAAAGVAAVLAVVPGLRLGLALPLAAALYGAGLLALRTFSAAELRQFGTLATRVRARLVGRRGP
jgi:O-antigen/teichoic acid export membrane protein